MESTDNCGVHSQLATSEQKEPIHDNFQPACNCRPIVQIQIDPPTGLFFYDTAVKSVPIKSMSISMRTLFAPTRLLVHTMLSGGQTCQFDGHTGKCATKEAMDT